MSKLLAGGRELARRLVKGSAGKQGPSLNRARARKGVIGDDLHRSNSPPQTDVTAVRCDSVGFIAATQVARDGWSMNPGRQMIELSEIVDHGRFQPEKTGCGLNNDSSGRGREGPGVSFQFGLVTRSLCSTQKVDHLVRGNIAT